MRGEPVAVADGYVSVPMHAPATGRVSAVDLWATAEGPKAPAIVIDVYDGATQEILYEDPVDIMHLAADEIVQAVKDAGLVGLGGAAFPSHVKLLPPDGKSIHTVVVNGCECEPYLTSDHRTMLERPEYVHQGIRIVLRALGIRRAVIGIEANKPDAIEVMRDTAPDDLDVTVQPLEVKYPQGAEKMLIKALFGAEHRVIHSRLKRGDVLKRIGDRDLDGSPCMFLPPYLGEVNGRAVACCHRGGLRGNRLDTEGPAQETEDLGKRVDGIDRPFGCYRGFTCI